MDYWVGFDVGKRFHWLCVLNGDGAVLFSRRVDATEEQLEAACSKIAALGAVAESASSAWICWEVRPPF